MAAKPANPVIRYIRRMAAAAGADLIEDQQLLDRFVTHQDEAAFEALLQRYGPLVWGVCQRILQNRHDADDAFQATFLVLVRKAGSLGRRDLLGPWLYGVAYRIAVRARVNAAKRRRHEQRARRRTEADPMAELDWRDLRPILDEEVQRLPEKYRVPFILCHLEGKTNEEAALLLGCPKGTVLSRLARARERLRARLTRRGLVFSVAGLATVWSQQVAPAAVPGALTEATIKAALPVAAGQTAAAGIVSASVAALTRGELQMMVVSKFLALGAIVLGTGIVATGAGFFGYRALATAAANELAASAAAKAAEGRKNQVAVPSLAEGVILVLGTEIKEGDQVPVDQVITVNVGGESKKFRPLKKGDVVEDGQLLGLLDDRLARMEVAIKRRKVAAAEAEAGAAEKTNLEAKERYLTQERLYGKQSDGKAVRRTSLEDLRAAKLLWETKICEAQVKKENVEVAKLELEQAQTLLSMWEIRSPARGVIKTIYHQRGEAVRKLEPVVAVRLSDKRE
jgi:RNA polymerase sigma factor (sigma-70 family)